VEFSGGTARLCLFTHRCAAATSKRVGYLHKLLYPDMAFSSRDMGKLLRKSIFMPSLKMHPQDVPCAKKNAL
jgi:hypothetical protein